MGAENEAVEQICRDVEELAAEVQSRGELLIRYGIESLTSEIARRGVGLHPLVGLLEEAHVAFVHPVYGARIATAAESIVRLGRKRGIHFIVSTQAPDAQSIPPAITKNCTNGLAFAVARHQENDALLGQGAYSAGHRATELIPGVDRGTCVAKGLDSEARSTMVQAYFLSGSEDADEVSPIIARAVKAWGGHSAPAQARPAAEPRDLLDDVADGLGEDESVNVVHLADRLRELVDRTHYSGWDGARLRRELGSGDYPVRTKNRSGKRFVDAVDVNAALRRRDADEADL